MTAGQTNLLFSWDDVDALPDLRRLGLVLDHLPGGPAVEALRARRGRGRDDHPVEAMWRALVAGAVFQHASIGSLLRELNRNPGLLSLCGFDPLPRRGRPRRELGADPRTGSAAVVEFPSPARSPVPGAWNFSRFLASLEQAEAGTGCVTGMMDAPRGRLKEAPPDFGERLGYGGKAVGSHSTGRAGRETGRTPDPEADRGKHGTRGVDKAGKSWSKVKSRFGYGLHPVADTHCEIPVAFEAAKASASESKVLSRMVRESLSGKDPELAGRCSDSGAGRGLDGAELKRTLWDDYGIRPLIGTREMWRDGKAEPGCDPSKTIPRPLHPERVDTVPHSEKGGVVCRRPRTGGERPMAFQGFEAGRGTLKCRRPAAAYDLDCKGRPACCKQAGCRAGDCGRVVRIDPNKVDRRIFTPTPHGGPSWRRGHKRRAALERTDGRLDNDFGFERHCIRGRAAMTTRAGLALAVMMALALGHVLEGRPGQMRPPVGPVPFLDTG